MSIEEVESLRKKARNVFLIGILITLIAMGVVFYITENRNYFLVILMLGVFGTIVVDIGPKKKFIKAFKDTFVLKALQSTFDNLTYDPDRGIDESVIENTEMLYMGDKYSSNDFISGTYKGIKVIQADVNIEEKEQTTDSNGNSQTTWVTLFLGRWMIFDFNKNFKANIQVRQKGFGDAKLSNWGQETKYQKVKMEDQDFNNKFRIYAQSDEEAFYILTPALMEKIKKLADNISGKLLLCFIDNKLHVGLEDGKDSFEHSIFVKLNEQKVIDDISKDIKLITNFIDELNLDNDLFKGKGV